LTEAGLPNATGKAVNSGMGLFINSLFSGALSGQDWSGDYPAKGGSSATINSNLLKLDLSKSNPIYGNSPTVQTQSIAVFVYIVLASAIKSPVEIDINEVMTDVNLLSGNKADKDFSNVTDSAKVMMATALVPSGDTTVLTVGPTNSDVTAPATGWFYMWGNASSAVPLQFVLTNTTGNCAVTDFNDIGYGLGLIMPVKAGHKVRYNYGTNATSIHLWFIKATGSVNE
jgi:hypothetical protein